MKERNEIMSKLVMLLLGVFLIGIAGDAAAADPVGCFNFAYGNGSFVCHSGRDKVVMDSANVSYAIQNLTDKVINVAVFDVHLEDGAIIEVTRFALGTWLNGGGSTYDTVSSHRTVAVWCDGYPNLIKNAAGAAVAVCT